LSCGTIEQLSSHDFYSYFVRFSAVLPNPMIGQGLFLNFCSGRHGILLKYQHIGQILRYFKKYRNIEIASEISISLTIYQKIFGNIVIVINIDIPNIAQP
jgi:hypothetical protein